MTKTKIAVGLSGGVDSSVAALLLKQQGYEVIALFMQNWHDTTGTLHGDCAWEEDRMVAEMVARKLDIPFHFIDLSEIYRRKVVDYMFDEYQRGRTPNPDVLCNREIKFDVFLKAALELGVDKVATGHYARVVENGEWKMENGKCSKNSQFSLWAGSDPNKDQSYFLCQLSQEQLAKALFPIGHLLKPEVRRLAAEAGLPSAEKKDSQGICFVGKVDLPVFLQQKIEARKGDILEVFSDYSEYGKMQRTADSDLTNLSNLTNLKAYCAPYNYTSSAGKKVGEHEGAHFYTIGQRKGLGVGGHVEPVFVIATDVVNNIVYVGEGHHHPGLLREGLFIAAGDLHWIRPDLEMTENEERRYSVRIRYRQPLQQATLYRKEDGLYILFDELQRGIAAGQFAAWYDGDELIGSGVIA